MSVVMTLTFDDSAFPYVLAALSVDRPCPPTVSPEDHAKAAVIQWITARVRAHQMTRVASAAQSVDRWLVIR